MMILMSFQRDGNEDGDHIKDDEYDYHDLNDFGRLYNLDIILVLCHVKNL